MQRRGKRTATTGAGLVRTLPWNELLFVRVLTGTVAQTAPVFLTGFVTSQGLFLAKVCAASLVVSLPVPSRDSPRRTSSSTVCRWARSRN